MLTVPYYIESRMIDILLISNSQAGYYMAPWLKSQFPNLLIIDYVHMEEWYWKAGGHARTSAVLGEIFYKTYFFFQAEDGIRDLTVTGVQTCALPI